MPIKCGSLVKDIVTGYKGVVIGRADFMYGCNRLGVLSETLVNGVPQQAYWFDEQRMEVVNENKAVPIQKGKFSLGDEVKDTITGFRGIVSSYSQTISGTKDYGVLSTKMLKDPTEQEQAFFEGRLVLIKAKDVPVSKDGGKAGPGGPQPADKRRMKASLPPRR